MTSSGMPQMKAAFAGWTSQITVTKRVESVVDGLVVNTDTQIKFKGTIQPFGPKQLALKPEGQRSWEWLQIHCLSSALNLLPNDRIIWKSKIYKVMAIFDYSLNGFIEYHVCRDYQLGGK